jgi:hypothetical protein
MTESHILFLILNASLFIWVLPIIHEKEVFLSGIGKNDLFPHWELYYSSSAINGPIANTIFTQYIFENLDTPVIKLIYKCMKW